MCLDTVDGKPQRKFGVGYKALEKKHGLYLSWDYPDKAGTVYPMGEWMKDHNAFRIHTYRGAGYEPGYHIALSKPRLVVKYNNYWTLVIVKCKFRKVVATGYDGNYGKVVVAREMILLEEVK